MNPDGWFSGDRVRRARTAILIVAGLLFLLLLAFSGQFQSRVNQAAAWTIAYANANPLRGAVIFVVFSALSAMLAFASSFALVPAAVAVWGKTGAFLLLWLGWTMGAAAAYGIGRLATPLLIRLGYGKKLVRYQRFVSRELGFGSVFVFCLMVPSEVPGYLFGGAHFRFPTFIVAMALAESVYAFALVVAGEHLLAVKLSTALIVVGAVVVAAGVILAARRWWRRSR